mmetsp:Transcript_63927/g.197972  ORF Transcript_63927/g.197972 Transcript_63927/m.197972 type:complete len:234 (+) Transcript_63927:980-1681(+)
MALAWRWRPSPSRGRPWGPEVWAWWSSSSPWGSRAAPAQALAVAAAAAPASGPSAVRAPSQASCPWQPPRPPPLGSGGLACRRATSSAASKCLPVSQQRPKLPSCPSASRPCSWAPYWPASASSAQPSLQLGRLPEPSSAPLRRPRRRSTTAAPALVSTRWQTPWPGRQRQAASPALASTRWQTAWPGRHYPVSAAAPVALAWRRPPSWGPKRRCLAPPAASLSPPGPSAPLQ